jgi:hypothetical protein
MIIEVTVGAMEYGVPQLRFEGSGIGIMAISGDPRWDTTGDSARGPEKDFCRGLVPLLAQQDIDQIPIPIAA